jgi:nucleotide-binding universal stress UspA family protein
MIGSGAITGSAMEGIVTDHESVNQRAVNMARSFGIEVTVTGETVLGAPAYALVGAAQDDDTIVIGATSHPGRLTDVLGSVATVVAHRARGPVVVVHGAERRDSAIGRVAVGIDGSSGSDAALLWATEEAIRCGAELVLVHGWSYPYQGPRTGVSEPRDDMRLDAMRTLEASAVKVRELEPGLRCHSIISEQNPAKAIIDAGKDADLVVVGYRGHGGFSSLLLGSVSRTVLQHSTVPVVVIRHRD